MTRQLFSFLFKCHPPPSLLQPSTGRVTGSGGVEIDCTVATYGPMGGSVEDCTLLYALLANQDVL